MTDEPTNQATPIIFTSPDSSWAVITCAKCGASRTAFDGETSGYLYEQIKACCHGAMHGYNPHDAKDFIDRAADVNDLEQCVSADLCTYYDSIDEAAEDGQTYVFGVSLRFFSLDPSDIEERILDQHHDDAGSSDLNGLDELYEAIRKFNKKQLSGSYEPNLSVRQRIDHMKTFAMIKPCAYANGKAEAIKSDIVARGFSIFKSEVKTLTREEAEWLYSEHKEKAHFNDLVDFTISGEVELMVLKSDNSNTPLAFRELMGPTDIEKAAPDTLRAKYATDFRRNAIHGSDSPKSAIDELAYFME